MAVTTHESMSQARQARPRAAILRPLPGGKVLAFDTGEDAIRHPTAQIFKPMIGRVA